MRKCLSVCVYTNALVVLALSVYVFVLPAGTVMRGLRDPGLDGSAVPRRVWRWHRALSPRYAEWARHRVASGVAGRLTTSDIAGTEWPLFGSVFYLWATRSMRTSCDRRSSRWRLSCIARAANALDLFRCALSRRGRDALRADEATAHACPPRGAAVGSLDRLCGCPCLSGCRLRRDRGVPVGRPMLAAQMLPRSIRRHDVETEAVEPPSSAD